MSFARWICIAAISSPLLCGCVANEQLVPRPNVQQAVDASKSRVYVVRAWRVGGSGVPMHIHDDSIRVGSVAAGSYLVWDRAPGRAMIFSESEAGLETAINVELKPGDTCYVEARVEDIGTHQTLAQISPEAGRRLVEAVRPAP